MKKYLIVVILFSTYAFSQKAAVPKDTLQKYLHYAYVYYDSSMISKSVEKGMRLLEFANQSNNDAYTAEAYYILGLNDEAVKNYKTAKEKYLKALDKALKVKDTVFVLSIYNGLGSVTAMENKNYKGSEQYYLKGLAISEQIQSDYSIVFIANLCWNYLDEGKYHEVDKYIPEITTFLKNPIDDGVNSEQILSSLNHILARYYSKMKNYELSEKYFAKAIAIGKKNDLWEELKNAYQYRSDSYRAQGDYQKAYEDLQKSISYKEKYVNQQSLEQLKIAQAKFDLHEYQTALVASKRENKLMTSVAKTKNKLLFVYCSFAIVFLLLFIYIYKKNRSKKKLIKILNEQNYELEKTKREVTRATEVKSQFIANISHEIRTPLHGIIGITSLLLSHIEISKENKKLLKSLKFSGDYLLSLINNVLLMSKIDNDKIRIHPRRVKLKTLIYNLESAVKFSADKNDCKLEISIEKNLPEHIYIDDTILFEILINLIDNGIKFTKNGVVTLRVSLQEKNEEHIKVRFEVIDKGQGIPEDKQEIIFQEFSQISLDKSIMDGTGLGLSIVQNLLKLIGSEIKLHSKVGEGSVFYFDITCKMQVEESLLTPLHLYEDYAHKKILLIEDNEINSLIVKKYLTPYPFKLDVESKGKEGLNAALNNTYDLILLDLNLPKISGFEISKRIREKNTSVPIIAITASEIDDISQQVKQAGMNDIVVKPFSVEELINAIHTYLK